MIKRYYIFHFSCRLPPFYRGRQIYVSTISQNSNHFISLEI